MKDPEPAYALYVVVTAQFTFVNRGLQKCYQDWYKRMITIIGSAKNTTMSLQEVISDDDPISTERKKGMGYA